MIITIKGANFKDSNIGTLSSYTVRFSGNGVSGSPTSIAKNEEGTQASANYVGTITVSSSYTYKSVSSVTVNGTALSTSDYTVSGMKITIPANKINGNVVITVATEKVNTEPEQPGTGGGSDIPSVPDGTINLYNVNDPDIIWGKTTEAASSNGGFVTNNTKGVSGFIAVKTGDVIRGGTYRLTTNTDGTNFYPYKSSPVYWYDSNKKFIGSTPENPCFTEETSGSNDFKLTVPTTPTNIAYFRVMISKEYSAQIITVNNAIDKNNYVAYPNPTTLEGTISEVSTSINMFNPADSITDTTTTTTKDGPEEWTKQSDRGVSGFIQVKGGDIIRGGTYRETTNTDGTNYYPFKSSPVYLYDVQLNFIGRINSFTESNSDGDFKATIPVGVKYFRVMINTKYNDSQIITVNNAIDKSNFVAYSK
jgi:hypothetical protein